MRQGASAYRRALKRQSGIFAEPHAGIIPLKRRSASCWTACVARTALLSCAARKRSIRTCTTVGRRSFWRRVRNGSPATRRVRRPQTRSRSSRLRRASSRRQPRMQNQSGRYSFFVDRPDIARREVAQTESTPVVVDAVVEADARRTLLKCGVGALEDLYAIFVDGEGIADSSEFEYVAVDAGSSVPHEISEIVQGPVPAD